MTIVSKSRFLKWIIVLITTFGVALFFLFPFTNISSLAYSITLNFLLMIWISIVESLLKPALKSPYFNSHPIEQNGKIYEYIGVHLYRKLLVMIGWEKEREKKTPINMTLASLEYYEYRTRASEFGHGIISVIIAFFSLYVCINYSFKEILWLTFFNLVLNIYPIMVQRYNRPRVQRVINKLKSRKRAVGTTHQCGIR